MNDLFGMAREKKIIESGVRSIFTPNMPINTVELFFGRAAEVGALIEYLNTPGQHALLFGDRGVGKSSLANIASELLLERLIRGKLYKKSCDSADTFRTIMAEPLLDVGISSYVSESEEKRVEGGKAGLNVPGVSAGVNTSKEITKTERGYTDELDSPSWVATKLAQLNGLFVIDELDVLASSADRARIAELLKHLSDAGSGFKILLVGIAETGAELMRGHPSVERCLRETKLNRMADKELRLILTNGEKELKLRFDSKAKDKIVAVSSGYPHFTHLLALKAAEDAIAESRSLISVEHIALATERAVGDSEGSLKRLYDDACRSHGSDKYRRIVCAAAVLGSEEFTAKALRLQYSNLYGSAIDQQSINNCFGRLCSDNSTTILRRIAKGVYRFNDPRMPSFIRMANVKYLN
jgi:hypothetical protein